MHARLLFLGATLVFAGCAHQSLNRSDLSQVSTPAFVGVTRTNAGPKADVFRADGAYAKRLGAMSRTEADRRLQEHLLKGMTQFEASETVRSKLAAALATQPPWGEAAPAADVARTLQSLLVKEVPADEPDYPALTRIGVDAVVELVVEEFGLRSRNGKAGTYLIGYGRMFRIPEGTLLWRRAYVVDQVASDDARLDPFKLVDEPHLFRTEMNTLFDAVVEQFAQDLSPR